VLMAAEHGDAARRGFWASWPQAGVPAGNLLAAAALAIMAAVQTEADFLAWGWRVPFILSALLVIVGWYIRNRVAESPMFEAELDASEAPARVPAVEVLRERPKALLLGAGLRVGENISYYILTVFSLTYLVDVSKESRSLALNALLIGAAVQLFAIPLLAALSDRIGRRPVYALGAFGLAAWCFVMFGLLGSGDNASIVLALVVGRVARGDVRPAGGIHHRAIPDPHPLFGRVASLPADVDRRRLARADYRAVVVQGVRIGEPGRDLRGRSLRDQRNQRASRS
jgi:MFS family permease